MESTLVKPLCGITLASLLLVAVKSSALLQYWQQTHHIFLQVERVPTLTLPASWEKSRHDFSRRVDTWMNQTHERMLLAGQVLLLGDEVLPRVEVPVMVAATCPEPVVEAAPACPEVKIPPSKKTTAAPAISATDVPTATAKMVIPVDTKVNSETATADSQATAIADVMVDPAGPISLTPADQVLLIGDSLMQGVAPHVITSIKRKFGAQSVDLSRHSTGLTYPGFFNWPETVKSALTQQHYAAMIIFLGANDPWDMTISGKYIRFGSDKWKEIYSERVASILNMAAEHKTRVIWLGAPPMGREDLAHKVPVLNDIYSGEIAKQPFARFIPTGPKLTTDGITFTKFIELPERGSVMVRTDDGVHFTAQGQRILAALTLDQFILPNTKITQR